MDSAEDLICTMCGSMLKVEREYTMYGVGFGAPGTEVILYMQRVRCERQHAYDRMVDEVEMKAEDDE